ncbi:Na+/H+ antiporter NhaA [Candidatus Poriferisodalis sp.]|uniref:Na+/H+ antiporter NhaA n=1 Tax=Candidatus Poriferisodalis sp. TaxID=3101277 RepID=UPI003B024F1E
MSGAEYLFQRETFAGGDRWLARYVARPILRFVHREVASSALLLVAATAALIWANSPWSDSYFDFWHTQIDLSIGGYHIHPLSLEAFVDDGLMALFFFVVGLEIKRELVTGYLSSVRAATLPAIAAVGGMAVPALAYFAFNPSGEAAAGWGIPTATDIAFAVGVVALLGSRVPPILKVFLLTLAIVDDIGAIAIIAIFYSGDLNLRWLALAVGLIVVVRALALMKVWVLEVYWVVGVVIWYATLESGVHATIAGVVLGLMTPAKPLLDRSAAQEMVDQLPADPQVEQVHQASFLVQESVPLTERLEALLHPFTAFLIVPVFALANAGVPLSVDTLTDAAGSPVTWGVLLGLVVGKPLGIAVFTWVATRFGFELPEGMNWLQLVGMGFAAGIGFTVSIFITRLAFDDGASIAMAKIGILVASGAAGGAALVLLWLSGRRGAHTEVPPEQHQAHEGQAHDDVSAVKRP